MYQNLDLLMAQLQRSNFRAKFYLNPKDAAYLVDKGMPLILSHARDFVEQRLAPAFPAKDGKQTPWKGHPVFIAQHATATCCRGCLEKWHRIGKGQPLTEEEKQYIVRVIEYWLEHKRRA
ncbi:Uncharacterised protein [Pragia fontium]|uniref:DUF4186 domain-containing protein n=1 Tax=Pragia fontium TaxID=82985 RepID=UPI000649ABFE|nr:DUF4186 domain-containing protein [Pragia fontium]AKJ41510.1 hypothetical protein QQ39_04965 [Pragia fontium]SUB81773.1 Uncharacterised protein [Pragia fontium]SUC81361.1 Uncharacterised protein [Pragia fontium]